MDSLPDLIEFASRYKVLFALVLLQSLDIVMGLLAAFGAKAISSTVSWKGMCRKIGILVMAFSAIVVEKLVPGDISLLSILLPGYFCVSELISLTEKCGMLGIKLPKGYGEALAKLREDQKPLVPVAVVVQEVLPVEQVKE